MIDIYNYNLCVWHIKFHKAVPGIQIPLFILPTLLHYIFEEEERPGDVTGRCGKFSPPPLFGSCLHPCYNAITLSTSIVYAHLQLLFCMHHNLRLDVLQFWSVIFEYTCLPPHDVMCPHAQLGLASPPPIMYKSVDGLSF